MKRAGYTPQTAAAIEATASTGGQIIPPVMGSVAFIMAALLAVPYFQIVITAIIPSVFYFLSVFTAVYFLSRRLGIQRSNQFADRLVLWFFLPLFVVPLVLMTVLLASLFSVAYAAFYSILALIGVRLAMLLVARLLPAAAQQRLPEVVGPTVVDDIKQFALKLIAGLRLGSIQGAGIAVVMGTCGVLAEAATATGAAVPLGWAVDWFSGDSLFRALLATALLCVILGAGLPTVGAYILTAAFAAPIVIELGVAPYTAHFFILYFACLSALTPPVAAAALAASAIAGSPYMRTGWEATWLAVMLYVLPFLFVYEPALLAQNMPDVTRMTLLLLEVSLITVLVSAATQSYFLWRLTVLERGVVAAAAIAGMVHVATRSDVYLGLALAAASPSRWCYNGSCTGASCRHRPPGRPDEAMSGSMIVTGGGRRMVPPPQGLRPQAAMPFVSTTFTTRPQRRPSLTNRQGRWARDRGSRQRGRRGRHR